MLQANFVRSSPRFRTAVDGGGARIDHSRVSTSAGTRTPPAVENTESAREVIAVTLCVAAAAGLWGALIWVLAAALEVPALF
jgi:hypothetical protein